MVFRKLPAFILSAAILLSVFASAPLTAYAQTPDETGTEQYNENEEYHPQITGFSPLDKGVRISWHSENGAVDFILLLQNGSFWEEIAHTRNNYFYHKGLSSNTQYIYTLRAFDENGDEVGTMSDDGFQYTYFDAPVMKTAEAVFGGLKVSWEAVDGAPMYTVFRKADGVWTEIGNTASPSFTDKDVVSGEKYSYTVSCADPETGAGLSRHDSNGVSAVYVAAPEITTVQNLKEGVKLSWDKVPGASKYRVFIKQGDSWKKLGDTSDSSYLHESAVSQRYYTYTVRALDANNNFISGYFKNGFSNRYFTAPLLLSAESVYGGVKVSWEAEHNAQGYRLYRKVKDGSWETVKDFTQGNAFTDRTVAANTNYTYTVRVVSSDQKTVISPFDKAGISLTYRKAPEITETVNYSKSTRIYFDKVPGAAQYKVFVRDGDKWKTIGTTKDNWLSYSEVESGVSYTYTVRALNADGSYLGGYNPNGYKAAFYAPPVISSVTSDGNAYTIRWKSVADVPSYRVYRKTICGEWEYIGYSTTTSFTDTKADKNQLVSYTVRCRSNDNKLLSRYREDEIYYCKGKKADGSYTLGGKNYSFSEGKYRNGFITLNKKTYYYDKNGNIAKDLVVGNKTDGYYYAEKNGLITYTFNGLAKNSKGYWYCKNSKVDFTYRNTLTYEGKEWLVLNGKATKVQTDSDWTLYRAFRELEKCTDSSMSKYEKLKAAYYYVQKAYTYKNQRIPHYHGMDWPEVYANDMFLKGAGNCFSYAASFAYMAKALGYEEVYVCNGGSHGWAEINGKVYDPQACLSLKDKSYFGVRYDKCKKPAYKKMISPGYSWMRIKIYD